MKKIKMIAVGLAHPHVTNLLSSFELCQNDFELVGFADVPNGDPSTKESRTAWIKEHFPNAVEMTDWKQLIHLKPDLVLVNSDNGSRYEICSFYLEQGVHVMDEKPMTPSFDEAYALCKLAKEKGVQMLTNWPVAWFPAYRKAKELLEKGAVGKLMRITYRSPATWGPFSYSKDGQNPPDEVLSKSWWYHKDQGGGSINDYACYGAALSTFMFGKRADKVAGMCKNFLVPFSDVEDYSAMMLDFGDGIGLLEGSWSTYNPGAVPTGPVLYGTEGTITCDRRWGYLLLHKGRSHGMVEATERIELEKDLQKEKLAPHVADVIRGNIEPDIMLSSEFNLSVVAALDAGRQSAEKEVFVKVNQKTI